MLELRWQDWRGGGSLAGAYCCFWEGSASSQPCPGDWWFQPRVRLAWWLGFRNVWKASRGSYILDYGINSVIVDLASMQPYPQWGCSSLPANLGSVRRGDLETQIQSLELGLEALRTPEGGKTTRHSQRRADDVQGGRGGGKSMMWQRGRA